MNKSAQMIIRCLSVIISAILVFSVFGIIAVSAEQDKNIYILKEEKTFKEKDKTVLSVNVPSDGNYAVSLEYLVLSGKAEIEIKADGSEIVSGESIKLFTLWQNEKSKFEQDNQGNDIRPIQVRSKDYYKVCLYDRSNGTDKTLELSLNAGVHTFEIIAISGVFSLRNVKLLSVSETPSYKEYSKLYKKNGGEFYKKIQAERAHYKSEAALYPGSDRNSPDVEPNNPAVQKLNIIGGSNWANQGEFLEWKVNVPEDGLYSISFKYRQNINRGVNSHRRILIDGELPFKELDCVSFPYGTDWELKTLGEGNNNYNIYLTKGDHRITLEVVPGEIGKTLNNLKQLVLRMNENYRKIIMVTSTSPDTLRDYNLDQEIPELMGELKLLRDDLSDSLEVLESLSNDKGSECAFIHRIVAMFDDFLKNPDEIVDRLDTYSTFSSSIAQYAVTGMTQPLELDYLVVSSADKELSNEKSGFLKTVHFRFMRFIYSFVTDYSNIGNTFDGADSDSSPLEVWVSVNDIGATGVAVGRDQSQVLKGLIDRDYSLKYNQSVNLSLVSSTEALMQAVMAGTGPDVALFTPKALAGNLALREALVDLNDLEGIENIKKRFYSSALKAYTLEESLFALPETQSFNMLFFRKDILSEMNVKIPESWEDFYNALYTIQKQNLLVGVINSPLMYEAFLLQNNGNLYNENMSKIALTEPEAIEAFEMWCRLYTLNEVPYSFNAFNRFRTGEMPLVITSNSFANQLWASAPELEGLWGIAPIPGMMRENSINRTQTCSSTGAVIIKDTEKLKKSYEFIDWWTSKDAQLAYSRDVESTLGMSARHLSANIDVFEDVEWENEYKQALSAQWNYIDDFYISPASYFVTRNITNAFRKVVMSNSNPRDTLNKYSRDMQEELERKRKEFGLS